MSTEQKNGILTSLDEKNHSRSNVKRFKLSPKVEAPEKLEFNFRVKRVYLRREDKRY